MWHDILFKIPCVSNYIIMDIWQRKKLNFVFISAENLYKDSSLRKDIDMSGRLQKVLISSLRSQA